MCGIVGMASPNPLPRSDLPLKMRDEMCHRGPDDQGMWWREDGRAWLGHRRLSILDLSQAGHQPMIDGSGRLQIVFNGEIYNHRALRKQLEDLGHHFRSTSDTEVLLAAYREWGTECLNRLNGMFGFAIHDGRANRLFLARDRVGEKSIFFIEHNGALAFASELKAILADPSIPRQIDPEALNHYLTYGFVPRDLCILRGFHKLRQGEAMTYDLTSGRAARWEYWSLPNAPAAGNSSESDLCNELLALLQDSVRLRLEADVPVGVLLSGGVDSSLVVAMAAEASTHPVRTFTVAFPGHGSFDESPFAQLVAGHFGTRHTVLVAEPASWELLPQMARQFDEPMADSSMIPTYLLSKVIREHATVALGGDGGDELFGGYPHYSWLERSARIRRRLPRPIARAAASLGSAVLPMGFKGRNYLAGLGATDNESVASVNMYFDAASRRRLLPSLAGLGKEGLKAPEALKADLADRLGPLSQRAAAVDFMTYLVDDILVKVDRASMLASLEVRCPWLDPRIVEFAFARVPAALKVNGSERKILSRMAASRVLPPELDLRRKQGFTLPLDRWFTGEWGDRFESILLGSESIFDREQVNKLFQLQRRGYPNTQRLFALGIFELWRMHYGVDLAS